MENNKGGRDMDANEPVNKRAYSGEMLFDDDDDYDDDADDYGYDAGGSAVTDDLSDSAFGPDEYDEDQSVNDVDVDPEVKDTYASDYQEEEYYDDEDNSEYAEDGQDMSDKTRKKKNRVWGIILAVEIVAAIVIGFLFVKAYINSTYNKMQYNELKNTHINEDLDEETVKKMTGYTNIALLV